MELLITRDLIWRGDNLNIYGSIIIHAVFNAVSMIDYDIFEAMIFLNSNLHNKDKIQKEVP